MIFKIDEQGYFLEDYLGDIEDGQEQFYVPVRPPQPCYKPRWNGAEWIEEGEAPELPPQESSEAEKLQIRINALEEAIMMITLGGM